MNIDLYNEIADRYKVKKNITRNAVIAFLTGGFVGLLGEGIIELMIYYFDISRTIASTYMIMIFIILSCFFTALGFFDKLVCFARCGLIIPITGFAHSMASAFLDFRKEGLIYGVGSNAFKLSGTVIVYGVLSAWLLGIIRFIIGG